MIKMTRTRHDDVNDENISLRIINTDNSLTEDELRELKKLAAMSKISRWIIGIIFAIISMVGIPSIIEWLNKHLNWV